MNLEDQFQDTLSRLENGEPLETCAADLPAHEAELLRMVVTLPSIAYPAQTGESIASQRAQLLKAAAERRGAPLLSIRAPIFPHGRRIMLAFRPGGLKFAAFAAALGAILIVIIAGL